VVGEQLDERGKLVLDLGEIGVLFEGHVEQRAGVTLGGGAAGDDCLVPARLACGDGRRLVFVWRQPLAPSFTSIRLSVCEPCVSARRPDIVTCAAR
jgi:hypothetical protein